MPNTDLLLKYEEGIIEENEFLTLFQEIFDTKAYQWLQGHYGRTCEALFNEGLIK